MLIVTVLSIPVFSMVKMTASLYQRHSDVSNTNRECSETCANILHEWKSVISSEQQLVKSSVWQAGFTSQTLIRLFENDLNLNSINQDCCHSMRDCKLLKLSFISVLLDEQISLKGRGDKVFHFMLHTKPECKKKEENIHGLKANVIKRSLEQRGIILFFLSLISSRSSFVTYKATNVFLKYFAFHPNILTYYLEEIKSQFCMMLRNGRLMLYDAIQKVMKQMRRELREQASLFQPDLAMKISSQIKVWTLLLHIGSCDVELPKYIVDDNTVCISKLKMIYQVEKFIMVMKGNFFDENCLRTANDEHTKACYSEEMKKLIAQSGLFLENLAFHLEDIFVADKFSKYATFIKLKILLFKLESGYDAKEVDKLANRFINYFIEADFQNIIVVDDHGRSSGFGDSLAEIHELWETAKIYHSSSSAYWTKMNLRILILTILRSCLVTLQSGQKQHAAQDADAIDSAMVHISIERLSFLMFCAVKQIIRPNTDGFNRFIESQLYRAFPMLLMKIMIDEDDQLCKAVATLLQICKISLNYGTYLRQSDAKEVTSSCLSDSFPHRLMYSLLAELSFDHSVCIDWLISDETCFHNALLAYLEIILSNFNTFVSSFETTDFQDFISVFEERKIPYANDKEMVGLVTETKDLNNIATDRSGATSPSKFTTFAVVDLSKDGRLAGNLVPEIQGNESILGFKLSLDNLNLVAGNGGKGSLVKERENIPEKNKSGSELETDREEFDQGKDSERNPCEEIGLQRITLGFRSLVDYDSSDSECESFPANSTNNKPFFQADRQNRECHFVIDSCDSNDDVEDEDFLSKETLAKELMFNRTDCEQNRPSERLDKIMDFFIRLRLQLERISAKSLSKKHFEDLISLLTAVEEVYDARFS